jgi:hypothetical protein
MMGCEPVIGGHTGLGVSRGKEKQERKRREGERREEESMRNEWAVPARGHPITMATKFLVPCEAL